MGQNYSSKHADSLMVRNIDNEGSMEPDRFTSITSIQSYHDAFLVQKGWQLFLQQNLFRTCLPILVDPFGWQKI